MTAGNFMSICGSFTVPYDRIGVLRRSGRKKVSFLLSFIKN